MRLAEADPKNAEAQRDLSISYKKLGDMTLELGQAQIALEYYRKGFAINQKFAEAEPKNALAQRDLSYSYEKLGDATLKLGETKTAFEYYHMSMTISRKLAVAEPKSVYAQRELAICYENLAVAYRNIKDYESAAQWYQTMLDHVGQQPDPNALDLKMKPVEQSIIDCRDAAAAIADIEYAFTKSPDQISVLLTKRVKALLYRKQPIEALATADRLAEWAEVQKEDRDDHRYNAACTFALCAAAMDKDRDALVEKSIALLNKVKAGGDFDAKKIAHIKQDADFNGIRQHPKFVAFMAELEKKAEVAPTPRERN
jgi:tetratricopeptide (TPR) repeat protein